MKKGALRDALEPAYFAPEELTEERLDVWHAALQTDNGMTAYMARANRLPPAERDSQLREISTPVLIITGDTNAMVEVAVAKRYAELIPRNEFEIWKDTRHMVQEQRPERVIAAIRRWASDSP